MGGQCGLGCDMNVNEQSKLHSTNEKAVFPVLPWALLQFDCQNRGWEAEPGNGVVSACLNPKQAVRWWRLEDASECWEKSYFLTK